jgi:hypothetical protein
MTLEETRSIDLVAPPREPQEVVLYLVRLLEAARLHRDGLAELGYAEDVLAPLDTFAASLVCSDGSAST